MKIKKYSVDVISPGAITPYSRDSVSAGAGNLELDTRSLATSITDSCLYAGNPCMSMSVNNVLLSSVSRMNKKCVCFIASTCCSVVVSVV